MNKEQTKPVLSVDEILDELAENYYPEHEYSQIYLEENLARKQQAKAHLIELVESVQPEEVKFIENREWYNLGITAYKQALIKAIKGGSE